MSGAGSPQLAQPPSPKPQATRTCARSPKATPAGSSCTWIKGEAVSAAHAGRRGHVLAGVVVHALEERWAMDSAEQLVAVDNGSSGRA